MVALQYVVKLCFLINREDNEETDARFVCLCCLLSGKDLCGISFHLLLTTRVTFYVVFKQEILGNFSSFNENAVEMEFSRLSLKKKQ